MEKRARELFQEKADEIMRQLPEGIRRRFEGAIKSGEPEKLLLVLKVLREQLDIMISQLEEKLFHE